MLFNDAPCSMPYSVAMNLRHASVTSSSDADRSPRQRESVNLVKLLPCQYQKKKTSCHSRSVHVLQGDWELLQHAVLPLH